MNFFRLQFLLLLFVFQQSFAQYNAETNTYTLQDSDVEIENGVIMSCSSSATDWGTGNLIIPEILDGQNIHGIENVNRAKKKGVFEQKGISSIKFPETLDKIGAWAFVKNDLIKLVLPNTIRYIGESAFYQNYLLQELILPNSLDTIRTATFDYAKIKTVTIPNSVKYLASFFTCDSLKEVIFEKGSQLEYIRSHVFGLCPLIDSVELPSPIKEGHTFIKWIDEDGNTVEKHYSSRRQDLTAVFVENGSLSVISGTISCNDYTDLSLEISGDTTGTISVNESGNFSFVISTGKSIVLTPTKEDETFSPSSIELNHIDGSKQGNLFIADSYVENVFSVSGTISIDNASGLSLQISGDTTGTIAVNADGNYEFAISEGKSITITPKKDGTTFTPESVTLSNIQENKSAVNFEAVTETSAVEAVNRIIVSPNPTKGIVTVISEELIKNILVNDFDGKTIMSREVNATRCSIDLSTYSKGVYYIKISTEEKTFCEKIIKE